MIVTDLAHAANQVPATPALQKGLAFLREAQGKELADGRIAIDGERVYALVQSYETLTGGEWKFEGHRRYIDIQYIALGEEVIGWAPTGAATVTMAYDEAKDIWLGTVPASEAVPVRLTAGYLAVLYPEDAHAPKRAAGAPVPVKKIVVKVAI